MIWITWRRYRVRLIMLALYVVALIVFMVLTEHSFHSATAGCQQLKVILNEGRQCNTVLPGIESKASYVAVGLGILPLLIGLVLGTPMVASEFAGKTNRLAWLQGITRTRWLLATWLTLAIPTVVAMSLLAPVVQWWATHTQSTFSLGGDLIQPAQMVISGVDPIALALLALTFAMFVGIVCRRIVSPYATSVIGLGLVMTLMPTEVLSSLASKVVVPNRLNGIATFRRSLGQLPWLVRGGYRRLPGFRVGPHAFSLSHTVRFCTNSAYWPNVVVNGNEPTSCFTKHGWQSVEFYQPASHYWILQWREAGLYAGAVLIILGLSVWAVRRWRA